MIASTFLYQRKRSPFAAKLSLVALMDIFTILVFFLLLSSGESEVIQNAKFVDLPGSTTGTTPHKELVVSIGKEEVSLEGVTVAQVSDIMAKPDAVIDGLAAALQAHTESKGELSGFEKNNGLAITVMGDKSVPYVLLKSVMVTSRLNDYRNISLAVNQIAGSSIAPRNPTASDEPVADGSGG